MSYLNFFQVDPYILCSWTKKKEQNELASYSFNPLVDSCHEEWRSERDSERRKEAVQMCRPTKTNHEGNVRGATQFCR